MKKSVSEGLMIATTVLLLTVGVVAAWFILKWIVNFFFPNLF